MPSDPVFASRLARLPLLDGEGASVGRLADVVIAPPHAAEPPLVVGFVASMQRRRIFVSAGRVGDVDAYGLRLRGGTVDLRQFRRRAGEQLAVEDLIGTRVGDDVVSDLALEPIAAGGTWEVTGVALATTGRLRRRSTRVVGWRRVADLFASAEAPGGATRELVSALASLGRMHPSQAAAAILALPLDRRRRLAEAMEDERLADVLEELPEEEQLRLVADLDLERLAHVVEEMDPDDAVDLLAEMTAQQQADVLEALPPEEAADFRRLLRYDERTAGGLMNPEPVVVAASATVAEALARLRVPDLPPALAAQVFVVRPPTETPTGRFLGTLGFQRLLREPPGQRIQECLGSQPRTVSPDLGDEGVAATLAAYNLLAVAVVDRPGRLLGAVTVDDVLDRVLPADWRERVP